MSWQSKEDAVPKSETNRRHELAFDIDGMFP